MDAQNCLKCNESVARGDKFCQHCGFPIESPSGQSTNGVTCIKCGHDNLAGVSFCESCGTAIQGEHPRTSPASPGPNKIISKGNYSGTMKKSGSSFWKKLLITLLIIVLAGAVAIFVWFQIDPDAGKKFKDILEGTGVVLVVMLFLWIFSKGKKKGGRGKSQNDYDDDNWDDDGGSDDGGSDDGGDDD